MPRYALKIEYDGGPFVGWQKQSEQVTVQGVLNAAINKLEADCEGVTGAGRTDTGVHATGQVAHVDLQQNWTPFRLNEALNYHLKPHPVAVLDVALAPDGFHARFDARERRYLFRLISRRAPLTFDAGQMWRINRPLDLAAMQEGAAHLLGRHDFTTFRSSVCQADSPVRTLDRLDVSAIARPDGIEYRFDVRARSFLHNQVRSFVGTLERVGAGAWTPDQVAEVLAARDRTLCGPVCPPQGLYLAHVGYPDDPFNPSTT